MPFLAGVSAASRPQQSAAEATNWVADSAVWVQTAGGLAHKGLSDPSAAAAHVLTVAGRVGQVGRQRMLTCIRHTSYSIRQHTSDLPHLSTDR
jgi:hypothetical protein